MINFPLKNKETVSPSISPLSYGVTVKVSFSISMVFKTLVFLFSKLY
jgi:hypothetical protein